MLYLVRKQGSNPARMEKAFAWINTGFAAGYTGIAAHNMTLR